MGIFNWRNKKFEDFVESMNNVVKYRWVHQIKMFNSSSNSNVPGHTYPAQRLLEETVNEFLSSSNTKDIEVLKVLSNTRRISDSMREEIIIIIHYRYKQLIEDK